MAEQPDGDFVVEETWVTITEATEKTGYSHYHLQKLARDNWILPENERAFRVRKPANGYLVWLPDLIQYIDEHGNGPYIKKRD
jgi:hypothetical protein